MDIDFESYHIGMLRAEVRLCAHDPAWAKCYALLEQEILEGYHASMLKLFHIGSTAIPSVEAKPIIDVLGTVPCIEGFDAGRGDIEALGFRWKGEYGITGRRYCVLYNEQGTVVYVHLHVFAEDHLEVSRHLRFRDCLRRRPELAAAYNRRKAELQDWFPGDRASYTEGKSDFIASVLEGAG